MGYKLTIAFAAALAVTALAVPLAIPALRRMKFGQFVRDDGPQSHLVKAGTPTMGGVVFMPVILVVGLLFAVLGWGNMGAVVAVLLTGAGFAAIGFVDDYIKVFKKRSLGFRAYQKLAAQILVTGAYVAYLLNWGGLDTEILIPFTSGKMWDLGPFYIPLVIVVMLGTVNGVNLTDGLDGLATSVTAIVMVAFLVMSLMVGGGIEPVMAVVSGSLVGFLLYNKYPARIFMGDTGSLGLGGLVAAVAIYLKLPLMILIVGFIYLAEVISVMIQVAWFKKTGKRVFKMAPLHHHFEESGWKETKVTTVFALVTSALAIVGILSI